MSALAAASLRWPAARIALLKRGHSLISSGPDGMLLNLLRACLDGTDRHSCLRIITAAVPAIDEIGGPNAIYECVQAIKDVHNWWP